MPEPNILTRQDVGVWQIFVRWWCSLVVFDCSFVRLVEFGSKNWMALNNIQNWNGLSESQLLRIQKTLYKWQRTVHSDSGVHKEGLMG